MILNAERLMNEGSGEGRYAQLLQHQWALCPQALVIQRMGNHPR
jgi:hypothetical protein